MVLISFDPAVRSGHLRPQGGGLEVLVRLGLGEGEIAGPRLTGGIEGINGVGIRGEGTRVISGPGVSRGDGDGEGFGEGRQLDRSAGELGSGLGAGGQGVGAGEITSPVIWGCTKSVALRPLVASAMNFFQMAAGNDPPFTLRP